MLVSYGGRLRLHPILGKFGWCASGSHVPTAQEVFEMRLTFVLHLPTVLLTWGLDKVLGDDLLIIFTPFTQIIFWTVFLTFLGAKLLKRTRKLA